MNFISAFEVIGPNMVDRPAPIQREQYLSERWQESFSKKSDRGDIHSVWFFCKNV